MIVPYSLYTDGQVFERKKESYIAVTNDKGNVVFFAHIGYKSIRATEGTAILKALEYLQEHAIHHATIYTDSMDCVSIIQGIHKIKQEQDTDTHLLFQKIAALKTELSTTIYWKQRKANYAGVFLGAVWRTKKRKRKPFVSISN